MAEALRKRIWDSLSDSVSNSYYTAFAAKFYQKWDLWMNIFLVLATSASVAAWVAWEAVPWLWPLIIAAAQIVQLVKPYIGFGKFVKTYNDLSTHFQHL